MKLPSQLQSAPGGATSSTDRDLYLEWLRGIAALLVLFMHTRGGYFVKWNDLDPASQNIVNYVLFFLTRLGREGVIIFFVLSGYLVGGRALAELRSGRYSFRRYMVARIARLYVVLVPALLLTATFDYIHNAFQIGSHGWQSFLINLFFLQNLLGPAYGWNAPLWSLSFEWWFYVLFGLALTASMRDSLWRVPSAVLSCAIAAVLWVKCQGILFMFPMWLFGVLVAVLPTTRLKRATVLLVACTAFGICIAVSSTRWDLAGDYLAALGAAILIYSLKDIPNPKCAWFAAGKFLSAFSFTLYALHYPLTYLGQSLFVPQRLPSASLVNWLGWSIFTLGVATICYIFYWLFERRTPMIRAWLERIVLREDRYR